MPLAVDSVRSAHKVHEKLWMSCFSTPRVLHEIDYLLGVHDLDRAGALRFKCELDGPFLDNDERLAAPPLSSLKEL